jgi:hypothetical protein
MDNPNTSIMHETQNGDKINKKQHEPHQSKWRVNSGVHEWYAVFFGGISDKIPVMLLIGMSNASVVWSFLLKRDKTNSYFVILLCSLTNHTLVCSVVWRIVARM